jgi:hypothetical protein
LARSRPTPTVAIPGAGTMFALRAIGLVILARWLFSMSQMNFIAALEGMASSPWACINLVFLFLLIALPGAKARVERPFHPLPQWLRQALRFFGLIGCLFALWSIGAFVWTAGWRRAVHTVAATNGWLVAAPALFAAVVWICRPRALWRTNIAARRFAIGRYAVSIDSATRTTVVWLESRKLGQYDARELSVRWPRGEQAAASPVAPAASNSQTSPASEDGPGDAVLAATPLVADAPSPSAPSAPSVPAAGAAAAPGASHGRPTVELLWDSPAAAGHNRQTVFRVRLATEGDRVAARALDAALKQV